MDIIEMPQRTNRTLLCGNCGERYSITYKRCPFCHSKVTTPLPSAAVETPTEDVGEDTSYLLDFKVDFGEEASAAAPKKGGKHLAPKARRTRSPMIRGLAVLLSLAFIAAAGYILVFEVYPAFAPMLGLTDGDKPPVGGEDPDVPDDNVTPPPPPPPAFTLSDIRVVLTDSGEEVQLSTLEEDVGRITWTIADETVAKVSSNGLLTAVATGTTTVTATNEDGFSVECEVLCVWDVEPVITGDLSLSKSDVTLKEGESFMLSIVGTDAEVKWSSANTAVATVSSAGTVTNVGAGKTVVTASVGGQVLECIVRCRG